EQAAAVGSWCLQMFRVLTACLRPILPALAEQAEAFLQCGPLDWSNAGEPLPAGHQVGEYKHLMQRVDAKQLDALFEIPAEAGAAVPPPQPSPSGGGSEEPGGEALAPEITIDDFV